MKTIQKKSLQQGLTTLIDAWVTGESRPEEGVAFMERLVENGIDNLISAIPEAADDISEAWDELTSILIVGCVENDGDVLPFSFDDLTFNDVIELRKAVTEINNLKGIYETEKNSIADMAKDMKIQTVLAGKKSE